jgi:fumarylacetoacetate (FAA) hydrolase
VRLASLKSESRNGSLIVVCNKNERAVRVKEFPTLINALQEWSVARPWLENLSARLNEGTLAEAFAFEAGQCTAPLPQAPGFYDGSAFLSHVVRARRARGDSMPESAKVTPLMYQGVSDNLLGPHDPIVLGNPQFGGDFEGEFYVITGDVPRGATAADIDSKILLVSILNDITLREIVKTEIETKFGFLQSKPNSSFAPIVVTPDELGPRWTKGRVDAALHVEWNNRRFGDPNGSEMHFSFHELVAHACRTRPLSAGSIVGSGTVSNEDAGRGFACLTEKRCV